MADITEVPYRLPNTSVVTAAFGSTANTTEDIVNEGCYGDSFNIIACVRYSLMSVIILVTGALCMYRIYRLHSVRHQALHHYLIFYSSNVVCIFCTVHWALGRYAQLDFLAQWFKQLTYLVVTHFFWTRAYRAIRRERLTNCCLLPGLVICLLFCTTTVICGVAMVNDYKNACVAIVWVLMSSAEVFITQTFLVAGCFISKRLDSISTLQSVRTSQKRKLWSLVIVFEISALVSFSYDLTMLATGSQNCGRIFHFDQLLYSIIFGSFMVIKFALPVWVMLATLDPIEVAEDTDDDDDSASFQTSDPILPDQRTVVRRLYQPVQRQRSPVGLYEPPPAGRNGVGLHNPPASRRNGAAYAQNDVGMLNPAADEHDDVEIIKHSSTRTQQ